ncbi:hypothetical protein ACMFMG_012119 [Clarireedia jacksonii]
MSSQPSGLITTHALYGAYLQASNPQLRESATVPLWEDILNSEFKQYDNIVVNSQQPLDDTTRSADLVVRSYDQEFKPVLLLVVECKRHSRTPREIDEMELQLQHYIQDYFTEFGKAQGQTVVYGAVAFGTKIRAWRFFCVSSTEFNADALMGGSGDIADINSYRDPYVPAEANQIRAFLGLVKDSKFTSTPTPQMPYTTSLFSSNMSTNVPSSANTISVNHSQEIIGPTTDHYYVFEQIYHWYAQGYITRLQGRPTNQWVYNYHGWSGQEAASFKWRTVDEKNKPNYS